MKRSVVTLAAIVLAVSIGSTRLAACCGFYVSKADTKIFNKASKVIIARDGDRTIMTMANDFQGAPKEFAVVIPVPTVLQKEQVHVGDKAVIDHLDAFTAPRRVEYFDENPCERRVYETAMRAGGALPAPAPMAQAKMSADKLGVTIEASYTVGEYDILIL